MEECFGEEISREMIFLFALQESRGQDDGVQPLYNYPFHLNWRHNWDLGTIKMYLAGTWIVHLVNSANLISTGGGGDKI